jgi:anti-sigma factor RsiW
MNLHSLRASELRQVAQLLEEKEALQAQLAEIESQIAGLLGAQPVRTAAVKPVAAKPTAKRAKGKRAERGSVKATIIEHLKAAGKNGITVKDLAARLNLGYNRVFNWFYATGKRVKQVKKLGEARYGWVG